MEPLFPQLGFLPGERELRMTGRPAAEVLQMLNPIPGIMNAMQQAGRAADTGLSPEERRAALGESVVETGIAALPIAGGALGRLILRNAPAATRAGVSETGDVVETLTAVRPNDSFDDIPYDEDAYINAELDRIFGPAPVEDPTMGPVVDLPDEAPRFEQEPFNPDAEDFPDDPWDRGIDFDDDLSELDEVEYERLREAGVFDDDELADDEFINTLFSTPTLTLPTAPTGMVSTVSRAIPLLTQPRYGSYEEVLANLRRQGARETELRTSGIASLQDVEGPISLEMIQDAIANDNPLEVVRTGAGSPPDDAYRMLQTVPQYEANFTPGGQDYREVIIRSPNALGAFEPLRGVLPDEQLSIPERHFLDRGLTNQVVHYRSKTFPTLNNLNAYHVGEIQSDWAQDLRTARRELDISRLNPEDAQDRLNAANSEYKFLMSEDSPYSAVKNRETELIEARNDGYITQEEFDSEMLDLRKERSDYEGQRDDLLSEMMTIQDYFDISGDQVVGRNTKPEPFVPEGPIVSSTNDVTQLAIRQAILDAVNSGEDVITFGTGDMAFEMTGGRISGQRTYYNEIVPRQVRQVLRRLKNEYNIEMPEVETFEIVVGDEGNEVLQEVRGFRLTPELRAAIQELGMPMFKEGGMVNLKSGLASMAREVL